MATSSKSFRKCSQVHPPLWSALQTLLSVPGPTAAPVKHCRALDTSSIWTLRHAARALRSASCAWDCEPRASVARASCKRVSQLPSANKLNRRRNSCFDNWPPPTSLRRNNSGKRQNNFHPRTSPALSCVLTEWDLAFESLSCGLSKTASDVVGTALEHRNPSLKHLLHMHTIKAVPATLRNCFEGHVDLLGFVVAFHSPCVPPAC